MPGMCEKKCGECGLCIGHLAQDVIDGKNAEINGLNLQVGGLKEALDAADAMATEYFVEVDEEWGTGQRDVDMSKSKAYTAYMKIRTSNASIPSRNRGLELQVGVLRDILNDVRGLLYQHGKEPDVLVRILRRIEDGPEKHKTNDPRHPVDYRKLLLKYMVYLEDLEGVTFVEYMGESEVAFSGEEVSELRSIAKETRKQS